MDYEINKNTLVVIPNGNKRCRVLECNRSYNINKSSFKVIEHSCEYFGVSYRSRLQGSQKFIKSRYKAPIIIEETSSLIFIPISSPTREDTLWVSYQNIADFYTTKSNKRTTTVRFKNNFRIELPISFYSFNNQYLKASRLSDILANRKV